MTASRVVCYVLIGLAVWIIASVVLGVLLGRFLRDVDDTPTP